MPPTNNDFASAEVLSGDSGTTTGDNTGATFETGEPAPYSGSGNVSIWYEWTPSASFPAQVDTLGSSIDSVLDIFTGSAVGSLSFVAGDDTYMSPVVTFAAVASTTYRIRVNGYTSGDVGAVTLNWATTVVPANDNFADAEVLTGDSGTTTGTNTNATFEVGEPAGYGSTPGTRSIWYEWTPSASHTAQVDTIGSGFDTVLDVYTGSAVGSLTLVAGDDDSGGGGTSSLTFAATGATTYHIRVNGYDDSETGAVTLNWELQTIPLPTFTDVDPTTGQPGTPITLTGTDLGGVTAIRFAGTPYDIAPAFTLVDDEHITTTTPAVSPWGSTWFIFSDGPYDLADTGLTFDVTPPPTPSLPITEDDAHIFTQFGPDENADPGVLADPTHFGNWRFNRDYVWNGTAFQYTSIMSRTTDPDFIHAGSAAVKMEWAHPDHAGNVGLEIFRPWVDTPFGGYSPVPPEGTTVQVSVWIFTPASNNVPSRCTLSIGDYIDIPGGGVGIGSATVDLTPDSFTQVVATGVTDITAASIAANDTAVSWSVAVGPQTAYEWDFTTNPTGGLVAGDCWYLSDADAFAMLGGWGVGMVRMGASA